MWREVRVWSIYVLILFMVTPCHWFAYLQIPKHLIYRVIRNDCRGFNNLPPCSPDATPCGFFLWGYVKDQVYVPPLHASIPELKVRIRTAIETITADMLQKFGTNSIIVLMFVESQRVTYIAPVRYVTKAWSVVLLNKKKHVLLSQVYWVWQVVKTPTVISNNPVY